MSNALPVDFAPLLDQATTPLACDPELRLEVRHELATHLEDSLTEYRAAGLDDQEAAGRARQDFGDAGDVGRRLWAAHQGRVRRRRVARWAGRRWARWRPWSPPHWDGPHWPRCWRRRRS